MLVLVGMSNGSIGIGRIAGIDIELHWMFILLILLFIFISPLLGLIWILLFVCVLIHELSHSITALRNKIKVSRIVLLPIGGASMIEEININPRVEFNISIAGPIMSLFLGGLFGILVIFTPPGIITFIVQYLFVINIFLGAFNILPAFPMDGGRVLRSYLEKKYDFYEATMKTARVSRYVMGLIIAATILFIMSPIRYSFSSKVIILIWDFIIVFFLYQGVLAEEESVKLRRDTHGMPISKTMSKNFAIVDYDSNPNVLYDIIGKKREYTILTKTPKGEYAIVNVFDRKALNKAEIIGELAVPIPNLNYAAKITNALPNIESNPFKIAAITKKGKIIGISTSQHINTFIALHLRKKNEGKA